MVGWLLLIWKLTLDKTWRLTTLTTKLYFEHRQISATSTGIGLRELVISVKVWTSQKRGEILVSKSPDCW